MTLCMSGIKCQPGVHLDLLLCDCAHLCMICTFENLGK